MDTATVVYSLMMFSFGGMVIVSTFIILFCLNEIRRRWSIRLGYQSGLHPEQGYVQMFGVALIRRYMTGASGLMIIVGLTASILLLLFSAPAVNGLSKMTPEEFLTDFQKFQRENK